MSIEAIDAVLKRSRQKSGPLLVLLVIAYYINRITGIAWPSVSTLARKVRMSKRNTQRCLRALEKAGELEVRRNQGRRGSNEYRILLSNTESNNSDVRVMGDGGVAKATSAVSPIGDVRVAQSVSEPKREATPVVPTGDDVEFWVKACFDCFKQAIRPVPLRSRRAIIIALPRLKKEHASSLLRFYRDEPLESKKPIYSARAHSPERLMLDLPRQLAFAIAEGPPSPTPMPPVNRAHHR